MKHYISTFVLNIVLALAFLSKKMNFGLKLIHMSFTNKKSGVFLGFIQVSLAIRGGYVLSDSKIREM
jgi:hypothetical protein